MIALVDHLSWVTLIGLNIDQSSMILESCDLLVANVGRCEVLSVHVSWHNDSGKEEKNDEKHSAYQVRLFYQVHFL